MESSRKWDGEGTHNRNIGTPSFSLILLHDAKTSKCRYLSAGRFMNLLSTVGALKEVYHLCIERLRDAKGNY